MCAKLTRSRTVPTQGNDVDFEAFSGSRTVHDLLEFLQKQMDAYKKSHRHTTSSARTSPRASLSRTAR